MFKHILILSAIVALAQCKPLSGPEEESARFNIQNPCPNCIQSGANAASNAITQVTTGMTDAGNQAATVISNAGSQAISTITSTGSQIAGGVSSAVSQATGAASEFGSQAAGTISNIGSQASGAASQFGSQVTGTVSQISSQVQQQFEYQKATLGQIIDRLGKAAKLTVLEERDSITRALKSIGAASGQTFKAGLDTAQSGFDIFLIVPKFAYNALGVQ